LSIQVYLFSLLSYLAILTISNLTILMISDLIDYNNDITATITIPFTNVRLISSSLTLRDSPDTQTVS